MPEQDKMALLTGPRTSNTRRAVMLVSAAGCVVGGLALLVVLLATPGAASSRQAGGAPPSTQAASGAQAASAKADVERHLVHRDQAYGSCVAQPSKAPLRWGSTPGTADHICCHNRDYAEYFSYWQSTSFRVDEASRQPVTFYDSASGLPLFVAPQGRSWEAFIDESTRHGWPSFRDEEVVWQNVLVLSDGETVSVNGTHLGHNLPDGRNRYCIDIVCVAGHPRQTTA